MEIGKDTSMLTDMEISYTLHSTIIALDEGTEVVAWKNFN